MWKWENAEFQNETLKKLKSEPLIPVLNLCFLRCFRNIRIHIDLESCNLWWYEVCDYCKILYSRRLFVLIHIRILFFFCTILLFLEMRRIDSLQSYRKGFWPLKMIELCRFREIIRESRWSVICTVIVVKYKTFIWMTWFNCNFNSRFCKLGTVVSWDFIRNFSWK